MSGACAPERPASGVSAEQLALLRGDLLRFARFQLRSPEVAEDLVQDTLEAALRNADSFAGRSSLKTWVFAILKNRIVDDLRRSDRTVSLSSLAGQDDDWEEQLEAFFDARGHWTEAARPRAWADPEQARGDHEFWEVFETCLEHLPAGLARVFMLREVLGFEPREICRLMGISQGNCHVMLHRARLKLRDCMEQGWGRPCGVPGDP